MPAHIPPQLTQLKDRTLAVVGAGRSGLAAVRVGCQQGARVLVVDDRPVQEFKRAVDALGFGDQVVCHGGGLADHPITSADAVVLSPGVPRAHPVLQRALAQGVAFFTEVDLGASLLPRTTFVGITGTNGKSTTTSIAGAMVQDHPGEVFVGGNLGEPLCDAVAQGATPTLCVLELSSYQLETLSVPRFSVAALTNLAPDHLDRYPSPEAYYGAKMRIFDLLLEDEGTAVTNAADEVTRTHLDLGEHVPRVDFAVEPQAQGVSLEGKTAVLRRGDRVAELSLEHPHLLGMHNLQNAMAAFAVATVVGMDEGSCASGLASYQGIPHRLERLGEAHGVLWVNDSKATNEEAAATAIKSFAGGIHLIAGGVGKGTDYSALVAAASGRVAGLYAIGADAQNLMRAFAGACPTHHAETLAAAVALARAQASSGEVLLLAPACASFDQFNDYQARGDAFRALFRDAARGG
jgi:UDP-N-acetylmuramoylalanine--D-glutamate ligase